MRYMALAAGVALSLSPGLVANAAQPTRAEIRTTFYGVPHVKADDFAGAGYQYDERAGVRDAIPGGPGGAGQYNLISSRNSWAPGKGWTDIASGSSFVMWTQFTDNGPAGRSVMSYPQSNNPESANHSDQTKVFSEKRSKPILFSESAIQADPNLSVVRICSSAAC